MFIARKLFFIVYQRPLQKIKATVASRGFCIFGKLQLAVSFCALSIICFRYCRACLEHLRIYRGRSTGASARLSTAALSFLCKTVTSSSVARSGCFLSNNLFASSLIATISSTDGLVMEVSSTTQTSAVSKNDNTIYLLFVNT